MHSCCICLETISEKSMTMPACSHVIHSTCFTKYIENTLPKEINCPICRSSVIKACPPFEIQVSLNAHPPPTQVTPAQLTIPMNMSDQDIGFTDCNKYSMFVILGCVCLSLWGYMIYVSSN